MRGLWRGCGEANKGVDTNYFAASSFLPPSPGGIKKISGRHPDRPHLGVTLHVLFEVRRRLELLLAGLAGVDADARQLFAMLLQVQGELALKHKLISALRTDQILQIRRGQKRQNKTLYRYVFGTTGTVGFMIWFPTSSFSCSMI